RPRGVHVQRRLREAASRTRRRVFRALGYGWSRMTFRRAAYPEGRLIGGPPEASSVRKDAAQHFTIPANQFARRARRIWNVDRREQVDYVAAIIRCTVLGACKIILAPRRG